MKISQGRKNILHEKADSATITLWKNIRLFENSAKL